MQMPNYRLPKVLVVDDNFTDLALVGQLLQQNGYAVVTAFDGDDAIDKVVYERPQCIILDVVLPKQSGFQVCRRLRQMPQFANIPIIMLSVKNTPADIQWGMQQGANCYITKPFRPDELLRNLHNLVA